MSINAIEMGLLPIREVLQEIRTQLQEAAAAKHGNLLFTVTGIQVELQACAIRSQDKSKGVKLWVLGLDSKLSQSTTCVHKITLSLRADGPGEGPTQIVDAAE